MGAGSLVKHNMIKNGSHHAGGRDLRQRDAQKDHSPGVHEHSDQRKHQPRQDPAIEGIPQHIGRMQDF